MPHTRSSGRPASVNTLRISAAVISTGIKFSVPLKFVPKEYGFWTVYAGYEYYYLNNDGLLDGNQALTGKPATDRETSLHRFYGGVTVFF